MPSRDSTTDIADINAISDNFRTIDSAFLDLVEKQIPELQTKENINLNFDDDSTNEEQYPSVPAVVNFTNRKVDPLKIINSASGNAIALKDSAKDKLEGLKLYGKTTQNGTPTPEAPIPLVSVGDSGSFEVGILTSNLITPIDVYKNGTQIVEDGKQCVKFITTNICKVAPIPFKSNTQYTVKFDCKSVKKLDGAHASDMPFCFFYSDGTDSYVSCTTDGVWRTLTLTSQAGKTVIGVGRKSYEYRIDNFIDINSFVFVEGASITKVEPYNKQALTLTDTLRSVGDIKDEVDFTRGVLIQRCAIANNFSLNRTLTNTKVFRANLEKSCIGGSAGSGKTICSHTNAYSYAYNSDHIHYFVDGGIMEVFLPIDFDETKASEIEVIGVLATPIETPLTETELNAYRQLYTNKGNTTILSEADMEVSYVADTKLYIDNKIAELTALTLEG